MGTFFSKPDQVWPSPGGFWVVNCFWNERFAFFIIPESTEWEQNRYGLATRFLSFQVVATGGGDSRQPIYVRVVFSPLFWKGRGLDRYKPLDLSEKN